MAKIVKKNNTKLQNLSRCCIAKVFGNGTSAGKGELTFTFFKFEFCTNFIKFGFRELAQKHKFVNSTSAGKGELIFTFFKFEFCKNFVKFCFRECSTKA